MGLLSEFAAFLEEYGVIGLAIAFVMGLAVNDLVSAVVDDLVMPVVGVLLPGGDWENATATLASIEFRVGHFLGAFVDFLVVALLIFLFVKYALPRMDAPS
jgi:large conductance mechanosensitive channel